MSIQTHYQRPSLEVNNAVTSLNVHFNINIKVQVTGKIDYAWKYDQIILIRFVSENRGSTGRYVFIIRSKYFLMYINDYFILKIKKSDIKPVSQMLLVTNFNAFSPVRINRLFAYCKGGNFNIHICSLFG